MCIALDVCGLPVNFSVRGACILHFRQVASGTTTCRPNHAVGRSITSLRRVMGELTRHPSIRTIDLSRGYVPCGSNTGDFSFCLSAIPMHDLGQ